MGGQCLQAEEILYVSCMVLILWLESVYGDRGLKVDLYYEKYLYFIHRQENQINEISTLKKDSGVA